jgi:hypothetical protein
MATHIRGRHRLLDPPKKAQICDLVAQGASLEEAADAIDVSLRTVQREAKEDEDFDHELKLSLRTAPDPEKIMQSAARTHWRAAAWLLERTDPERYAKRPACSASPEQLQAALSLVVEAALEATPPDERTAVYERVEAAAEKAFKCVFPGLGPWGRRRRPTPPPTPLADEQEVNRLRQASIDNAVPDYEGMERPRRVARPEVRRRAWTSASKPSTTPLQSVPHKTRRAVARRPAAIETNSVAKNAFRDKIQNTSKATNGAGLIDDQTNAAT